MELPKLLVAEFVSLSDGVWICNGGLEGQCVGVYLYFVQESFCEHCHSRERSTVIPAEGAPSFPRKREPQQVCRNLIMYSYLPSRCRWEVPASAGMTFIYDNDGALEMHSADAMPMLR